MDKKRVSRVIPVVDGSLLHHALSSAWRKNACSIPPPMKQYQLTDFHQQESDTETNTDNLKKRPLVFIIPPHHEKTGEDKP